MYQKWMNLRYYFFSKIYDLSLSSFYRKFVRILIKHVNASPGTKVLELGVGTGLTFNYYDSSKHITAIDASAAMLEKASQKALLRKDLHLSLFQACAEDMGIMKETPDQVVLCNTLSVVRFPDEVLKNWVNRLDTNGSVFVLNHFTPDNTFFRIFDRLMIPVGKILGFRSYFPLADVIDQETMQFQYLLKGYWSIVRISKKQANG